MIFLIFKRKINSKAASLISIQRERLSQHIPLLRKNLTMPIPKSRPSEPSKKRKKT